MPKNQFKLSSWKCKLFWWVSYVGFVSDCRVEQKPEWKKQLNLKNKAQVVDTESKLL